MSQKIRGFARLGLATSSIGLCLAVVGITPAMSQPTSDNSGDTSGESIPMTDISRPEGMEYSPEEFLEIVKERVPSFQTYEDMPEEIKKHSTRKDGMIRVDIPRGETATFPDGTRVEADGSIIKPSGFKTQPVMDNGKFSGRIRMFKPDGVEMEPGEAFTDKDGSVHIMPK